MWWEERKNFPSAFGLIRTKLKPGSPDANITVTGGATEVWQYSTELISAYEQSVFQQNNPRFKLRRILLLEGIAGLVTTCPSPSEVSADSAPTKFTSLGVCLSNNVIGEIWYILRVETAGNAFYWRLDITERFVPWFRFLMVVLFVVWFSLFCFIGVLVTTFLGTVPFGVVLLPIFLILAFLTRKEREPSLPWRLIILPLTFFESTRQERLDYALTYAPAISGALHEAVDVVEKKFHSKQNTNPPPQSQNASIVHTSIHTVPPGPGTSPLPTTASPAVIPIKGKLRK